jgi:hypothetical protein
LRTDIFFNRKSVHVKLSRETHTLLREKLFRHGITMQDLFQEAAELAISDSIRTEKFLEKISKKKLVNSLEKLDKNQKIGDINSDILYNLLEDSDDNERSSSE